MKARSLPDNAGSSGWFGRVIELAADKWLQLQLLHHHCLTSLGVSEVPVQALPWI